MTLFRLDASIRVDGSHSRQIADLVEAEWTEAHPGDDVLRRHVGTEPVPATAWAAAVAAAADPRGRAHDEQRRPPPAPPPRSTRWSRPTRCCSPCRSTTSASPSTSRPGSTSSSPTRGWAPGHAGGQRHARRAGHRPRRQLRRRHAARGLGPRHRVDAAHPGGRLAARPRGRRDRVHPGRRQPGAGRARATWPPTSGARPSTTPASTVGRWLGVAPPDPRLITRRCSQSAHVGAGRLSAPPSAGRGTPGARPRSRRPG